MARMRRHAGSRAGKDSAHLLRASRGSSGEPSVDAAACRSLTVWPRSCGRTQRTRGGGRPAQMIACGVKGAHAGGNCTHKFPWIGVHARRVFEGVVAHGRFVEDRVRKLPAAASCRRFGAQRDSLRAATIRGTVRCFFFSHRTSGWVSAKGTILTHFQAGPTARSSGKRLDSREGIRSGRGERGACHRPDPRCVSCALSLRAVA